MERPDSCNPVLLNCLYGSGVIQSVLTTFEATSQLLFAVNRVPASPMDTDDANAKQDDKEDTNNSWTYGSLASYGKLMDHLVTSSFILSSFTKHLLAQPLSNSDTPFPRDPETFMKVLQSTVLKTVLPVWTHPQFAGLSNKINLINSDGAVFEIDYGVALMSKRFEDITETISVGDDVDVIAVDKVSSKMLKIIVEYCKKHIRYYKRMTGDAKFVEVDPRTLLDLTTSACYMKIESLEQLTWSKLDELIKGKTVEEITEMFGNVDDSNSKLLEENIQGIEYLEM
ncbi:hypothetical protein RYX36_009962 [Vicia faba]